MEVRSSPESKANDLLHRILPEREWARFNETGMLEVGGSRGTYQIYACDLTRLVDPQTRRPRASACLQLSVPAPAYDRMVAEYMLIRNDEDLYWQTANIFPAGLDNRVFAQFLMAALDIMLLILLIAQLRP